MGLMEVRRDSDHLLLGHLDMGLDRNWPEVLQLGCTPAGMHPAEDFLEVYVASDFDVVVLRKEIVQHQLGSWWYCWMISDEQVDRLPRVGRFQALGAMGFPREKTYVPDWAERLDDEAD